MQLIDPDEPARDYILGDLIDTLIDHDVRERMGVQIPGQTKITANDAGDVGIIEEEA